MGSGLSVLAKKKLASSMIASFSSWSLGTKLSSVRTLATSGSGLSFSTMAEALARLGSRISMRVGARVRIAHQIEQGRDQLDLF